VRKYRKRKGFVRLSLVLSLAGCGQQAPDSGLKQNTGGASASTEGDAESACVPYDDTCPAGEYCQYIDGRTQCVAEGTLVREERCNGEGCQRGSICMPDDNGSGSKRCQQPCDLTAGPTPCFIGRHTCFPAIGDDGEALSFGVCAY
jgi:hypothetical protein